MCFSFLDKPDETLATDLKGSNPGIKPDSPANK
jgi:hypothetical protein